MRRWFVPVTVALLVLIFGLCGIAYAQFPAADRVVLPTAGHASNGATTFVSNVTITNLSVGPVTIDVIYSPVNTLAANADSNHPNELLMYFPAVIRIANRASLTFPDFFANTLKMPSGNGMLIFKAHRDLPDRWRSMGDSWRDMSAFDAYCLISVESSSCSTTIGEHDVTGKLCAIGMCAHCESFPGIPWHEYVSSDDRQALAKVSINWIKSTPQFRTKIGINNLSQWSSTTIGVTLFDGNGVQRGQIQQRLGPLENMIQEVGIAAGWFKDIPPNAWVKVEQAATEPIPEAKSTDCSDGCPAFTAYGVMIDSQTGDQTRLPPEFDAPGFIPLVTAPQGVVPLPPRPIRPFSVAGTSAGKVGIRAPIKTTVARAELTFDLGLRGPEDTGLDQLNTTTAHKLIQLPEPRGSVDGRWMSEAIRLRTLLLARGPVAQADLNRLDGMIEARFASAGGAR